MNYDCYTCGQNAYRLKDTSVKLEDDKYYIPTAKHIFDDYRYSVEGKILLPKAQDPTLVELNINKNSEKKIEKKNSNS